MTKEKSESEILAEETANEILRTQGRPKGRRLTAHGEVVVKEFLVPGPGGSELLEERQGGLVVVPYKEQELTDVEEEAMGILFTAIQQIEEMENRFIPTTRKEMKGFGVKRKTIDKLVAKGLIDERVHGVRVGHEEGKKERAMALVYPTPQGRAYITEHLDSDYYIVLGGENGEDNPAEAGPEGEGTPADS